MHYIRLLRPARIEGLISSSEHNHHHHHHHHHAHHQRSYPYPNPSPSNHRGGRRGGAKSGSSSNPSSSEAGPHLSLLVTITTDLGDSFLYPDPDSAVDLVVSAHAADDEDEGEDEDEDGNVNQRGPSSPSPSLLLDHQHPGPRFRWTPGLRVLELRARLRPGLARREDLPARFTVRVSCRAEAVVPLAVEMRGAACAPVALRALRFGRDEKHELCFEEDIGESIARHIWDAGVVVAGAFLREGVGMGTGMGIREEVLNPGTPLNVLELGTGVGILGISIAAALESAAAGGSGGGGSTRQSTVLLTDLPEAEERARANMARADVVLTGVALTRGDPEARPDALRATRLQYENLDWDEGRRGCFGPLVTAAAAPWDLVVLSDCTYNVDSLPSLVGTLSALHGLSVAAAAERGEAGGFKSTVLLATKPRHESEKALFGLLDAEGWRHRLWKGIPLPNIGGEDEVVEIYLLEKGGRAG